MEDQEKNNKIEGADEGSAIPISLPSSVNNPSSGLHPRHETIQGINNVQQKIKLNRFPSDSTYPSSSYLTADECPMLDGNHTANGVSEISPDLSLKENVSTEQLRSHIHHLQNLLAAKEADLVAVTQELDAVREMSCIDASIGPLGGCDTDFKASVAEYNRKIQEHASALQNRDKMIEKLAAALEQSVKDREDLRSDAERLTKEVHSLQTQLHSVRQHVQNPQTKLLEALKEKEIQLQKRSNELAQYKAQSSKEVQFLMSSMEEIQQRAARSASSSPPASKSSDASERRLTQKLEDLRSRHEADKKDFTDQMADAQKKESVLRAQIAAAQEECEKLNLEISSQKLAHETQLSVCRDHHETSILEHQQNLRKELKRCEELENQIQLLRLQIDEKDKLCRNQGDKIQVLQRQVQEFTTNITTCHQTLEQYKKKIDEINAKQSEVLNLRITELQETHSLQVNNMHQDLNRLKQRQMEEVATLQLSHENEVNTSKRDAERFRIELREKSNLLRSQEELLEKEQQWSRTCNEQVQELGKRLYEEEVKNEEYQDKIGSLEKQLKEIDDACTLYQPQIESLHQQLQEEREKYANILQQLANVRTELSLEQEKCQAYSSNLDAAHLTINELQRKNTEMEKQVLEEKERAKEEILIEKQRNSCLDNELITLKKKFQEEQSHTVFFKEEIESLNEKIKLCAVQEEALSEAHIFLDSERQSSAILRKNVEDLNGHLLDQKTKNNDNCNEFLSQIQEKKALLEKYQQETSDLRMKLASMEQITLEQKQSFEKNIEDLTAEHNRATEKIITETDSSLDKFNHDRTEVQTLCDRYHEQVRSLELKLKILSDANAHLQKEREESAVELNKLKDLSAHSKNEFNSVICTLREALSKKENDILELRKKCEGLMQHKKGIDTYNRQVKELMTAKVSLESELDTVKAEYCKEIEILKSKVTELENKLKICIETHGEELVGTLIRKCRDDIEFLRSFSLKNTTSKCGDSSDVKSVQQSFIGNPNILSTIPGLITLEKLLELCEKCSINQSKEASSETLANQLSKLAYTVEKLQLELEISNNHNQSLQMVQKDCCSQMESLKGEIKHNESLSPNMHDTAKASISNLVYVWAKQCEGLEKSNEELGAKVVELQTQIANEERTIPSSKPLWEGVAEKLSHRCNCEAKFTEERALLKNSIEVLQKELSDKEIYYEDKIKTILSKNTQSDSKINDNFATLINEFSAKAKDVIILRKKLALLQRENQLHLCQESKQDECIKASEASLEKAWQQCDKLQSDLRRAQHETRVLQARLEHLKTLYGSVKKTSSVPSRMILQLIDELSTSPKSDLNVPSKDNSNKLSVTEKVNSVIKIINKMNEDCERNLVKLQNVSDKESLRSYLQSEALGLRRLQTALLETQEAITSKCSPALQLHVDVLKEQLKEKDVLYEEVCQSVYSLEAEMREMGERFQQQDDSVQEQLLKHKSAARYWKIKAEGAQAQTLASHFSEKCHSEDLLNVLEEIDTVYSQHFSDFQVEVERVAQLKESKVKLEMDEKMLSLEERHKHQLEEISKHILAENNVRAIQELHKVEIDTVRAECNYEHTKAVHRLLKEVPSSVNFPLQVKPNLSYIGLSLLFLKHHISSKYKAALKKVSSSLSDEVVKGLTVFDGKINVNSSHDVDLDITVPDLADDTSFDSLEQLFEKSVEVSKKLMKSSTTELYLILSACEEDHKIIIDKVQNLISELHIACDVKNLQEELLRAKEEHRLALKKESASHKAEISRLCLLHSQQNVAESSVTNETALSIQRRELEEKHKRQMEELRTYFEQKCADFEKHYSEEVFSQHSRKLSDCSSASESELVSEMYYAGPGSSSCSGQGAPSLFCDLLGESSFKEIEECARSGDLEKLFLENREQIETLRLALESRHQGELEAQKELYEAKLEEVLQNITESHTNESTLHSKRFEDMQEVETMLNIKLADAQKEISRLEGVISLNSRSHESLPSRAEEENNHIEKKTNEFCKQSDSCAQNRNKNISPQAELESQLLRMAEKLKAKDCESSELIASLKRKLRENHEVMSKLEKDLSNLRSKYESDIQAFSSSVNEKVQEIHILNQKIKELSSSVEDQSNLRHQVELELNTKYSKLKQEYEKILESKDEQYKLIKAELKLRDTDDVSGSEEDRIKTAIEEKKAQLEAEYSEYLEFVKKCADDTKVQLLQRHESEMKQIIDKYESEIARLSKSNESVPTLTNEEKETTQGLLSTLDSEIFIKESSLYDCLQELLNLAEKLTGNEQELLKEIVIKICKQEASNENKLHQDLEVRMEIVQKNCEKLFHLQLEEARVDIVRALEDQIQQLLDESPDTVEKPPELQQLERKLASKYLQKLNTMQREHDAKVQELKEKHAAQLSLARNRKQSIKNVAITPEELDKLYKERDCLKNVAATLRDVVSELVRYFISWEDDFNNTLMDELAKLEAGKGTDILSVTHQEDSILMEKPHDNGPDSSTSEDEMPIIIATPAKARRLSGVKRVHFAPDISGILSLIDDESLLESVGLNCSVRDASLNFHEELDRCLARLRSESAALYALSKPSLSFALSQESTEGKCKEQLSGNLSDAMEAVGRLEKENEELRYQLQALQEEHEKSFVELQSNRLRLETLECEARQQAEIVAEGYGEGEQSLNCDLPSSPRATTVEELQNKARSLILGVSNADISGVVSPNSSQHLPHVVEELCRDWERLAEESRHKQDDLQQQLEAVDKQLRSLRTFMDEQAAEREQEREDFVQEIKRLQESLKDKERDRTSHLQMNHELCDQRCMHQKHLCIGTTKGVEVLEGQLKDAQSVCKDTCEKLEKLTVEHKQAVEKIWTLRDIISDLEVQVAAKAEESASFAAQNEVLQQMVEEQGRTHLELAQEMEELQLCSGNGKLADQIAQLEDQLRKHQVLAEQLGDPNAIEQMKIQLNDLILSLESHTKELECANAYTGLPASPCLSSPSEDVSIRETLEAIRSAAEKKQTSPGVILPFREVSQMADLWQKHARADDAVLKKIRDLDMQLDDIQAEKDALASRLQEQMLLSSSLQSKLDEHRRKADVKLSQATTEMQSMMEDLRGEVHNYVDILESKEKQIKSLRSSLYQAENDLRKREAEVRKSADAEHIVAAQLQTQVFNLSSEKKKLQALLSQKDAMHDSLPALVESMLVDKNADIDRLEKQVQHLSKQMELSSHYVATPSTTLEFEYAESEKVCAHVKLSPVLELRRSLNVPTINESGFERSRVLPVDTSTMLMVSDQMSLENNAVELGLDSEVSLKPVPLEETSSQSQSGPTLGGDNVSGTLSSSLGFSDTSSLSSCEKKVAALEQELEMKNKALEDYRKQVDESAATVMELKQKCRHLEECELKLSEVSNLKEDLETIKAELEMKKEEIKNMVKDKDLEIQHLRDTLNASKTDFVSPTQIQPQEQTAKLEENSELEAKESEIQCLRNEVCATQSILANLQRKVQEAKQIARSPSRSSPDNNQALRLVHNELEAAKQEIVDLKDLCKSIRSEVDGQYQQKRAELEVMLGREQQEKQSLLKTLEQIQEEGKLVELSGLEGKLSKAEVELQMKHDEVLNLRSELNQLNMECITLRQQISTPMSEVSNLASKLDDEKKFAEALKEELLLFKSKAVSLEEENNILQEHTKELLEKLGAASETGGRDEEMEKLLGESSNFRYQIDSMRKDQSNFKKEMHTLLHENAVLREENAEVAKELSDMKQVIIHLHGVKASNTEANKALQTKMSELNDVSSHMNTLSKELFALREGLKNIHGNDFISLGLAVEDQCTLHNLQEQLSTSHLRGAGDGPWNKLSITETDVHEISPDTVMKESLDDLTGLVQHELDVSVQLDQSLLQTIDASTSQQKPAISSGSKLEKNRKMSELKSKPQTSCLENVDHIKINQLEKELSEMKVSVQHLHSKLEAERIQYYKLQQQDCDLIEEMRLKLSEALDGQAVLHAQFQSELKRHRASLSDADDKGLPSVQDSERGHKLQEELREATSELLKLRVEKDALEKQLRRLQEVEIQRSRRRAVTEEKHRRRIDQLQSLHAETQQECRMLREELVTVNQKLQLAQEEFAKDRNEQLKNHAPFVERLKNMNTFLEEHIEENVRMAKQMEDLTEEHRRLRKRIAQLEGELAEKRSNDSFEVVNARFAAERAEWESEQKSLRLALNELKQKQIRAPNSDVEERVSHLFGRYLRMQSYRKALVWQKRYLLSVISGINESKTLAASHLSNHAANVKERQPNPRRKFRSVVLVTMAIHRMQFMVERWLRGKRIGCGVVVQQTYSQLTFASSSFPQSHQIPFTGHTDDLRSGLSQSPPTLERPRQPRSSSSVPQFARLSLNSRGLPLTRSLSESVTNFNLVGQRFDTLLSNPPK